ncbi:helix-turn-helix domain-containing protein [Lacticaseibacillus paracasei]|uniref:helix-turn-helix domain-containing protein n=1 Tax=Lacticaseibacillus paracasei TaxID=1597 RepID=UPI002876E70D|nr:helix-turn-helix domain-containing protein [Lacticaseibacillus paracasei]MDS0491026.1 helix-turn-helix domain-containing protein [Lacticaseibacillus paracasei]
MQDPNIGSYFREIRKRRNLRIEEIRGNLHQSTISHFERDHDDITLRNLLQILEPTFTTPEEFCLLVDDQDSSINSILKKISEHYDKLDIDGLKHFLAVFKRSNAMTLPVRLIILIVQSCLNELSGENLLLSNEDCDYVQDYLLQSGKWFSFEYIVFGNLAQSLPASVNLRLWKKMLTSFDEFHLPTYDDLLVNILYNVSASFLSQNDLASATYLTESLDLSKLDHYVLYVRHHVVFLKLLLKYRQDPKDLQNIDRFRTFLLGTQMVDETLFDKNIDALKALDVGIDVILSPESGV